MRAGENIRQLAGTEENTGGVMYIYIESGHYVVLAGGLRCHRVATSTTIKNKSMPASTSGTKSPFCINTNQLFNFYHSAAPTTHICVYFSAATPATIINSTNHHLQHAKLRILLQHLTSHAAYERSGGPPKRPAAKRPCIIIIIPTLYAGYYIVSVLHAQNGYYYGKSSC